MRQPVGSSASFVPRTTKSCPGAGFLEDSLPANNPQSGSHVEPNNVLSLGHDVVDWDGPESTRAAHNDETLRGVFARGSRTSHHAATSSHGVALSKILSRIEGQSAGSAARSVIKKSLGEVSKTTRICLKKWCRSPHPIFSGNFAVITDHLVARMIKNDTGSFLPIFCPHRLCVFLSRTVCFVPPDRCVLSPAGAMLCSWHRCVSWPTRRGRDVAGTGCGLLARDASLANWDVMCNSDLTTNAPRLRLSTTGQVHQRSATPALDRMTGSPTRRDNATAPRRHLDDADSPRPSPAQRTDPTPSPRQHRTTHADSSPRRCFTTPQRPTTNDQRHRSVGARL